MSSSYFFLFFFNDTPATEIYTLSLHDALPILPANLPRLGEVNIDWPVLGFALLISVATGLLFGLTPAIHSSRSEEHTSELQSHSDLVCRLLLEKKKKKETLR